MAAGSVKVKGLRQMHRAFKNYDGALKRELEDELRAAGTIVATSARAKFVGIDQRSSAGFKSKTKGFGRVVVQQSRRKTTGRRPDFGSLQMRRALLPAVAENEPQVLRAVEGMLDRIGRKEGF
jgi:hypothetical protein